MGIMRLAVLGAAGYGVWKLLGERSQLQHAAFAQGETDGANFAKVRHAGPEAMRSDVPEWDRQDERSDESFPASDPPATY